MYAIINVSAKPGPCVPVCIGAKKLCPNMSSVYYALYWLVNLSVPIALWLGKYVCNWFLFYRKRDSNS